MKWIVATVSGDILTMKVISMIILHSDILYPEMDYHLPAGPVPVIPFHFY